MRVLPMFPLGTVLFPHMILPLHVFEERYRVLTRHCLDGEREFGVVLIERGSEVGGGDERFSVGTIARIMDAAELPDDRWVLVTTGTRRIIVERWLPDSPHPWAEVNELAEPPATARTKALRDEVEVLLRRVLALMVELGDLSARSLVPLDEDPAVASYQAAALAPVTPLDAQLLLELDSHDERFERLLLALAEQSVLLRYRLGNDPPFPDRPGSGSDYSEN